MATAYSERERSLKTKTFYREFSSSYVLGNGETSATVVVAGGVVARTFARRIRTLRPPVFPFNLRTDSQRLKDSWE